MSGEGSQGNLEVPRMNRPLKEGGPWGKHGFPHGSEPEASDAHVLLERLGGRRLERGRGSVDVLGLLEEVLEDLPLALTRGRSEGGRLQIREIEAGGLRCLESLRRRARQCV